MLLAVATNIWSQTRKSDSLLLRLSTAKADTNKVLLLCAISDALENNDPEMAKAYLHQAGQLSRALRYDRGEYKYLTLYGNSFLMQGNFDSSLYYQQQALTVAQKMGDSLSIGVSLFNIGINYRERASYEKAIDYCLQGLRIIDKLGTPVIEAQVYDALQVLYYNRAQFQKAIGFGEKAITLTRKEKQRPLLAKFLINISLSYQGVFQLDKAMKVLEEALQISQQLDELRYTAIIQQNLASVALRLHNYPLGRKYAEETLRNYQQLGSTDGQATALRSLGIFCLQQRKLAEARRYAQQALALSQQWQYKVEEVSTLRLLSNIAYAERNYEEGLALDDSMNARLEVLIRDISSQPSAELEAKYESEKKENRIRQLEAEKKVQELSLQQKNTLNLILVGSAMALVLIGLLGWRNYRQQQALQQKRINELQTEKQLAATEAVLQGEEQERTRLAKDLHDGLGGMLSGIKSSFNTLKGNLIMDHDNLRSFERGIDMLDSSISEMRRVAHNLMPEALVKFGLDDAMRDFCNDIRLSGSLTLQYQSSGIAKGEIPSGTAIIIYRIVQELVSNVLKHSGAASALVQLIRDESGIAITVEDDGKGFDIERLQKAKGIGWSNIRSRVEYFDGSLDIQSGPGKGTSILIELPV